MYWAQEPQPTIIFDKHSELIVQNEMIDYIKNNEDFIYMQSGIIGLIVNALLFKIFIPINLWLYMSLAYLTLAHLLSSKYQAMNKAHPNKDQKYTNNNLAIIIAVVFLRGFFLTGAVGFSFAFTLIKMGF